MLVDSCLNSDSKMFLMPFRCRAVFNRTIGHLIRSSTSKQQEYRQRPDKPSLGINGFHDDDLHLKNKSPCSNPENQASDCVFVFSDGSTRPVADVLKRLDVKQFNADIDTVLEANRSMKRQIIRLEMQLKSERTMILRGFIENFSHMLWVKFRTGNHKPQTAEEWRHFFDMLRATKRVGPTIYECLKTFGHYHPSLSKTSIHTSYATMLYWQAIFSEVAEEHQQSFYISVEMLEQMRLRETNSHLNRHKSRPHRMKTGCRQRNR